jgi:hypothetical protein
MFCTGRDQKVACRIAQSGPCYGGVSNIIHTVVSVSPRNSVEASESEKLVHAFRRPQTQSNPAEMLALVC